MARDLDLSPRRRQQSATPVAASPRRAPAAPANTPTPASSGGAKSIGLWLFIIILLAIAGWALWQYFKPSAVSKQPSIGSTAASQATPSAAAEGASSLLGQESSSPLIQIYDSGAGEQVTAAVKDKLKALGYGVEILDKSQFNYDKTYVWYRSGLEAEASKVGSTMADRVVALKETKIAGSFDILILLGTK